MKTFKEFTQDQEQTQEPAKEVTESTLTEDKLISDKPSIEFVFKLPNKSGETFTAEFNDGKKLQ